MGNAVLKLKKRSNSYRDQELLTQLGKQIRKIRISKGRSIKDVDIKNQIIDRAWLCKLENGQQNPTISSLALLADELGTDIKTFFDFKKIE